MIFFLYILLIQASTDDDWNLVGAIDGELVAEPDISVPDFLSASESGDNAASEELQTGNPTSELENETQPQATQTLLDPSDASDMSVTGFQASENVDNAASEELETGNPTSELENETEPQATQTLLLQRNEYLERRNKELEKQLLERAQNEGGEALAQSHEQEATPSLRDTSEDDQISRDLQIAQKLQEEFDAEGQQPEANHAAMQRLVEADAQLARELQALLVEAENESRDAETAPGQEVWISRSVFPCAPIEHQIAHCIFTEAQDCKIEMCEEVQFFASETERITKKAVIPFIEHNASELKRIAKDDVAPCVQHHANELTRIAQDNVVPFIKNFKFKF